MSGLLDWRNTPERIIERAQPFLEPGEVTAHVVRAQEGPDKWKGIAIAFVAAAAIGFAIGPALAIVLGWLGFTLLYKRRVLLATDHDLVVLAGGRFRFTPSGLVERLPVETPIGPLKGLWFKTKVGERQLFVMPRCVGEVAEADADISE